MVIKIRSLGALALGAILLAAAGCGGPDEAEGASAGKSDKKSQTARSEEKKAQGRTDMPPADYVRYRCSECSCTVFTGEGADCGRPGCRHHWSTHVRSFK